MSTDRTNSAKRWCVVRTDGGLHLIAFHLAVFSSNQSERAAKESAARLGPGYRAQIDPRWGQR